MPSGLGPSFTFSFAPDFPGPLSGLRIGIRELTCLGAKARLGAPFVSSDATTSSTCGVSDEETALVSLESSTLATLPTGGEGTLVAWSGNFVAGWKGCEFNRNLIS
jgi:hypothetical protein